MCRDWDSSWWGFWSGCASVDRRHLKLVGASNCAKRASSFRPTWRHVPSKQTVHVSVEALIWKPHSFDLCAASIHAGKASAAPVLLSRTIMCLQSFVAAVRYALRRVGCCWGGWCVRVFCRSLLLVMRREGIGLFDGRVGRGVPKLSCFVSSWQNRSI